MPSQKSATAKAIGYALTRWDALQRYCDDGRIEIDNNTAERAMIENMLPPTGSSAMTRPVCGSALRFSFVRYQSMTTRPLCADSFQPCQKRTSVAFRSA
jgi:hypothetical protein